LLKKGNIIASVVGSERCFPVRIKDPSIKEISESGNIIRQQLSEILEGIRSQQAPTVW
jgi:hypothetical protein